MNRNLFRLSLFVAALTISSVGCTSHEGPLEKTGKSIDDAVDNIKEGDSPFKKKGTAERVGESIDKTLNGQ